MLNPTNAITKMATQFAGSLNPVIDVLINDCKVAFTEPVPLSVAVLCATVSI